MMRQFMWTGMLMCACAAGMVAQKADIATPAAPTISTSPALNGALVAAISTTTAGAKIYYTLDGSTPTAASEAYEAPFLVASNLTVKAIASTSAKSASGVITQTFTPNISPGPMVWSDEFTPPGAGRGQPNPRTWTYDTGNNGFGNKEQETYCAWGSNSAPCSAAEPSAEIGVEGHLHVVARQSSAGVYTSARLKSQGLFSFVYGRIEARIKLPESQGMWPAFWLLGNNITTVDWPACGELDVMEHIDGSNPQNKGYDWVQSSVHGKGLDGGQPYTRAGFSAADWHTYGMIWSKGQVQFYIDDPAHPYESFTKANTAGTWPFDQGPEFILLNLAVGGSWPGNVDKTTVFPSEMLVDYVRIYTF
ncbi:MAG TPA: family 16 glycosylhydrolase [Terracidiphilus sp.]